MEIKVHRGLEQIGGCITEISTDKSRVFIDLGQNLPGCGEPTTPEQDAKMVEGLFEHDSHKETAVFYTHAHEDHVGLFQYVPDGIPQYIGEGGKTMLIAKYELIKRKDEICFNIGSTLSQKNDSENYNASAKTIIADEARIGIIRGFRTWERTKPHAAPKPIQIGDIRITPFFNCHSIYDSYMFLIEADGKRIWHMGDYREHGYMGKGLFPTLKRYATDIDVLITEGTMLKRDDECIHEREVSRKMASVMDAFKYVVVLASATDIERLASIKEAAKKAGKRLYIYGGLMKRTMKLFTEREAKLSKGLFEFHPTYLNSDNEKMIATMQKNGFVLVSGVNGLGIAEESCQGVDPSEVLLIYSSWDGYYKDPEQVKLNPLYKEFRSRFSNVVDIHTSGHASKETIRKVINIVKPKEVICIHKEADAEL